jgi:DNA-binding MarR family transcriptional regulator
MMIGEQLLLHSIIRSGVCTVVHISLTAMTTRQGSGNEHSPTAIIEAQLSEPDAPVLGLYLHVAYHCFMASFSDVGRGEITPNLIGVLALLATYPGMSQAEMARLIGLERVTVGTQVGRAISLGFVRRDDRPGGGRRYALYLTPDGKEMLAKLRKRIPRHERTAGARLSLPERRQLRVLLNKLVYG